MKIPELISRIIDAVVDVQNTSGETAEGIDEDTKPIKDIEGFDSLRGLEVTVLLEEILGIQAKDKDNFFISEDGRRALSIREAAELLIHRLA